MAFIYTVNIAYINNNTEHKEVECLLCFHLQGRHIGARIWRLTEHPLGSGADVSLAELERCPLRLLPRVCIFTTICAHCRVY